jgi:chromatin remodeling complex protein RSC6
MVRATKSVSATTTTEVVAPVVDAKKARAPKAAKKADAPAAVVLVTETPAVSSEVKKEKKARVSKPKAENAAVVVDDATAAAPVAPVATEAVAENENALQSMIREQGQSIQSQLNALIALKNNHKLIEKQVVREIKNSQKAQLKKKKRVSNSAANPSSFQKPTDISTEISKFIGVEVGTKLSRTEVNSKIHEYVISHNLRDEKDKRIIYPDEKLSALLRIPADTKLGYFNIQSYLSGHFATRSRAPLYV